MDFGFLEDWLYVLDMSTGVWWWKLSLIVYYLVAAFVVRAIWRRTRRDEVTTPRVLAWLLLAAALIAPGIAALGAGLMAPIPVAIALVAGFAADEHLRVAIIEGAINLAVAIIVWGVLVACSFLTRRNRHRKLTERSAL